ncbi:hypothetical protein ACLSU7_16835 [Bdellovibrio sp. HCB185ZH]|uniref:hypothetical protein n=1 Tax=Bdellovibrio sp. HCB185ZH TaxID=3394235 RepID=UPI0039A72332
MNNRNATARYVLTSIWFACLAFCIFYLIFDVDPLKIWLLFGCACLGIFGAQFFKQDRHNFAAVLAQCVLMLAGITITLNIAPATLEANITLAIVPLVPVVFLRKLNYYLVIGTFIVAVIILIVSELALTHQAPVLVQIYNFLLKLVTQTIVFVLTYALRVFRDKFPSAT